MHILIHTCGCSGLVMVQRLQREGHDVSVFVADEEDMFLCNTKEPSYDGMVNKVTNLKATLRRGVDLLVFDFIGDGKEKVVDFCDSLGIPSLGAGRFNTKLELDRTFSTDIMKKAGILYPDTYTFKSFKEGINFVKKNPDRYVIKPNDNQTNYASYVSKNAEDMINTMEHFHDEHLIDESKGYILQKFIKGIEISVEGWFNGTEFLPNFFIQDIEEKKFLVGNLGPTTGCMGSLVWIHDNINDMLVQNLLKMTPILRENKYVGPMDLNTIVSEEDNKPYALEYCHDDQTEILTKEGWKLFKDISNNEVVATLNPDTEYLEYQTIDKKIVMDFDGEMVVFKGDTKSSRLDMKVTPDHQMYLKQQFHDSYKMFAAKDVKGTQYKTKRTANWKGKEENYFIIPEYAEDHYLGRHKKWHKIVHPARFVDMRDWLYFLGFYTAEGSIHRWYKDKAMGVSITQNKGNKADKLISCLNRLNFSYKISNKSAKCLSIVIEGVQLAQVLNTGLCYEKWVPDYVKELSPEYIKCFLEGYRDGDGCIHKMQTTYATTSKQLADDLQELILKAGYTSRIRIASKKGTKFTIGEKEYTRKHDVYTIYQCETRMDTWLLNRHIHREHYIGKVYCVQVANHIIMTRRGGEIIWGGNCPRFGFVCTENMQELLTSDLGELLYTTATGEPHTPEYSRDFCIGIRLTIPPYPMTEIPDKVDDAKKKIIMEFLDNRSVGVRVVGFEDFADSCYWDGVRQDEDREGLFSCNDILGSICGTGKTIDEAKALVYDRLDRLDIPDKQYRIDIGDRGKKWFAIKDKLKMQESSDYDDNYIAQLLSYEERKAILNNRGKRFV